MKLAGKLSTRMLAKSNECHWGGEYHWVFYMLLATMRHRLKKEDSTPEPGREATSSCSVPERPPLINPNIFQADNGEIFTESSLNITKKSKDGWDLELWCNKLITEIGLEGESLED